MHIAVFGTGEVGRTIATKLRDLGHEVTLGSRTADNSAAKQWAVDHGGHHGTFANAAHAGELIVNATGGLVSRAAFESAGADNLRGKTVVDVSNPLDSSEGFPPRVVVPETGSVAEELQEAFPEVSVVKTLNTMNNGLMVNPALIPGNHLVFLSGDNADAKAQVAQLLKSFGWRDEQITDLGGLASARSTEQWMPLWLQLFAALGTADFNITIARP